MTEDIEKLLDDVRPRGAPPELRDRVLGRVAETLSATTPTNPSRDREEAVMEPIDSPPLPHGRGSDGGRRRRRRLDTVLAWAVAGLVLLGVGLNFAAVRIGDARMAAYAPPRPEPMSNEQLVMALAEAGPRAGDALESRLVALRWSRRDAAGESTLRQYQEIVKQTLSLLKEPFHAACEEDTEVDVHRRGRTGRDTTDCQRHFGLDHRLTA